MGWLEWTVFSAWLVAGFFGSAAVRGDEAKVGLCPGGCWMFGLGCVMAGSQLEGQAVVVWVWLAGVDGGWLELKKKGGCCGGGDARRLLGNAGKAR